MRATTAPSIIEVWLWSPEYSGAETQAERLIRNVPGLDRLSISGYCDALRDTVLLRFRFAAHSNASDQLRAWAYSVGLEFVETGRWSQKRRQSFFHSLAPFSKDARNDAMARSLAYYCARLMDQSRRTWSEHERRLNTAATSAASHRPRLAKGTRQLQRIENPTAPPTKVHAAPRSKRRSVRATVVGLAAPLLPPNPWQRIKGA